MADSRETVARELVRTLPMLRAWLRHLGASWEDVDEALQETAAWCCAHAGEFEPGSSFTAWARAAARFRLLSLWRDRGRGPERLDHELAEAIPDADWDGLDSGAAERAAALRACLAGLPAQSARLIDLVYRQGLDGAAAASRIHSTANAVHVALSRLRLRLRACVERRLEPGA